jgi:hypothetical protein
LAPIAPLATLFLDAHFGTQARDLLTPAQLSAAILMVSVAAAAGILARTTRQRNDGRLNGQESHLVQSTRSRATLAGGNNGYRMPASDGGYRLRFFYAKEQPELTGGHAEKTPSLAFVLIPRGQAE